MGISQHCSKFINIFIHPVNKKGVFAVDNIQYIHLLFRTRGWPESLSLELCILCVCVTSRQRSCHLLANISSRGGLNLSRPRRSGSITQCMAASWLQPVYTHKREHTYTQSEKTTGRPPCSGQFYISKPLTCSHIRHCSHIKTLSFLVVPHNMKVLGQIGLNKQHADDEAFLKTLPVLFSVLCTCGIYLFIFLIVVLEERSRGTK